MVKVFPSFEYNVFGYIKVFHFPLGSLWGIYGF